TVCLACPHVVEKHRALGVGRRPLGELETLAHEPPVLVGQKNLLQLRAPLASSCRRRPAAPQPFHGRGKHLRGVLAVVAAVTPGVSHLVAREGEAALDGLIGHPPVAGVDVEIVGAILEEDAERLGLDLADER
ncbi:MAG: hypothetical protein ACK559_41210, partial [bacterium]